MIRKTLCGEWKLHDVKDDNFYNATVPGCNYLDLLNAKKIDDPFYKTNEKDLYWVAKCDWEYIKEFSINDDEIEYNNIKLCCEMLDTLCDVYINNQLVGRANNNHISYVFDIKSVIKAGKNELKIYFKSPVNYVTEKYNEKKCPRNSNGQNGITYIRKVQSHFGWDWGPVLPPSGIGRDIYIEFFDKEKITDVKISQKRNKDKSFSVHVCADVERDEMSSAKIKYEIISPSGESISHIGKKAEFLIKKPELWWTAELSGKKEQPLYTIVTSLITNEVEIQKIEKKIGLREIKLNRENDKYGQNFQFILNDVPLFIKGANYIPSDSFVTRTTKEKLEYIISSCLFSNMNMIRIWGGGYYESDEFYDICDRLGILVWQDFCFACQAYPFFDTEFLDNVKEEIKSNVLRLRHHASLALWCGNNEIETMSIAWKMFTQYTEWTEKFFYHILEDEVRKYDADTAFVPGTPCGLSYMDGVDKDNVGDTHLWAVWHGLQPMKYYRKRMTRFCSEFGFESLPDIKTIGKFANKEDYDLHSEVFTAHQKCLSGNDKMIYYIATRFNLPEKFEDFIYLSQVAQQECISDATEHWRRNKGRCNGAIYWQLNDCWSVCSWASLDYYGNYKALQYTAKKFNAPLSVSIEDTKEKATIFVINDYNKDVAVTVKYSLFYFTKGRIKPYSKTISVSALENIKVDSYDMKLMKGKHDLTKIGLKAELYQNEKLICDKTLLFKNEKELTLPKVNLQTKIDVSQKHLKITIKSDVFARLVRVESTVSTLAFSDNYFDILPNEEKIIYMPLDKSISEKEQVESIEFFCANELSKKDSKFNNFKERARVFLQPINFFSYLYNKNIPDDASIDASIKNND